MTVIAVDRPPSAEQRIPGGRVSRPWRARLLAVTAGLFVTALSGAMFVVGVLTAFRARRLYAAIARCGALAVLAMYGIRLRVHNAAPFPRSQTIYISNHTSTLDLFILVALGLPNCRFFLSGFLRNYVPLGIIAWMVGTFFTMPQDRPAERVRIFQRADRTLRRTGESVYLSPEGGRITGGRIGHFNKGAFHLATSLRVPIVPLYFRIPSEVDPGRGYDARPGTVDVYVLPTIDTSGWTLAGIAIHASSTRGLYVQAARTFSR
jgi:1-acyl-sn-glycerol-3-phosphate acyltransferase